jgi:hypothetical protein
MLAKLGSYVVGTDFLTEMMNENRKMNIAGECFFFYEALRANNNELGNFLKAHYYSEQATVPYRNGWQYRHKADIKNETDVDVLKTGIWESYGVQGYDDNILRTSETNDYCSIEYSLFAPENAYYDIYVYMAPSVVWTDSAHYHVFSDSAIFDGANSMSIYYDQSNMDAKGWQKIGTTFLKQGEKRVLKIDNDNLKEGDYLFADAVMLMINRKIKIKNTTRVAKKNLATHPSQIKLFPNYPNPFNPITTITYSIAANEAVPVRLMVYDARGDEVAELVNEQQVAGEYQIIFKGENLPSGLYVYRLDAGSQTVSDKMLLIK